MSIVGPVNTDSFYLAFTRTEGGQRWAIFSCRSWHASMQNGKIKGFLFYYKRMRIKTVGVKLWSVFVWRHWCEDRTILVYPLSWLSSSLDITRSMTQTICFCTPDWYIYTWLLNVVPKQPLVVKTLVKDFWHKTHFQR